MAVTQTRFVAKNGLDNNSKSIINVADPVNAQDVATKNFSTNASNIASGTIGASYLPSVNIGTTSVALNRSSGALSLTGINIDGSAGSATKSTNLVGGNNTTLLGSVPYQSNTDTTTLLAPNTTTTKKFLRQTGTGTNGAAPAWDTLINGDIPSALTGKTYNGLTLTAATTGFTVAGGTTSKTLTVSNTLTFTGTDSSSIAFGTGGTVAYTSNNLSAFAATTSAQLAGVISDETGSGALVFGTSPAITTSLTTPSASFALINTNATTVNFAGAATTLSIGAGTGTTTVNNNLAVTGNLTINGTTTTVNSTTMTVDDPIITLGGDAAPAADDNKDRGVEFRWHNGSVAKVGFFGFDDSTSKFTFIPDATNTSEVFTGTSGNAVFRTVESNVATGTAPFTVASTTKVTNLNADLLDDNDSTYYTNASNLSSGTVAAARLGSGTTDNTTFLRGDNTWQTVNSTPTTFSTTVQTATDNQTTFNISYDVGYIEVFANGIKLSPSEFTASNGTSVVLGTGVAAGTELMFKIYTVLSVGNALAQADTGTSLHKLPWLDGANTWSATQDFKNSVDAASLGSELTTNGTFTGNATGWTLGTGWAYSSNNIVCTLSGSAEGTVTQNISVTSGVDYLVTWDQTNSSANSATIRPSIGAVNGIAVCPPSTSLQSQSQVITAGATGSLALTFTVSDSTSTGTITIDNVSVKEITSIPANATLTNSSGVITTELRSGPNTNNTSYGIKAGKNIISASATNIFGANAGSCLTSGSFNVFIGNSAGRYTTTGVDNCCLGTQAGQSITVGSYNTALGAVAGSNLTTGSNNVCIGYNAQPSSAAVSNEITLGDANVTAVRIPGAASVALNTELSNWLTGFKVLQIGTTAFGAFGQNLHISNNSYYSNTTSSHVYATSAAAVHYQQTSVGTHSFNVAPAGTAGNNITFKTALSIANNGNATFSDNVYAVNFVSTSDERLKKDIQPIVNAIQTVEQLSGKTFKMVSTDKQSMGLIAQELETVIPYLVDTNSDGFKSVNYPALTGLLIEAIKELNNKLKGA